MNTKFLERGKFPLHQGGEKTRNVTEFTITLEANCAPDGTRVYRWHRSDGVVVSPEMSDAIEAMDYPRKHGFLPLPVNRKAYE